VAAAGCWLAAYASTNAQSGCKPLFGAGQNWRAGGGGISLKRGRALINRLPLRRATAPARMWRAVTRRHYSRIAGYAANAPRMSRAGDAADQLPILRATYAGTYRMTCRICISAGDCRASGGYATLYNGET